MAMMSNGPDAPLDESQTYKEYISRPDRAAWHSAMEDEEVTSIWQKYVWSLAPGVVFLVAAGRTSQFQVTDCERRRNCVGVDHIRDEQRSFSAEYRRQFKIQARMG